MNALHEEDPILKGHSPVGIASSFFLISSLCVAVPTLVWSLHCLYVCWKSGGRVSVFTIVLLLNVLLQSAFSPPWIMMNLDIPCRSEACDWTVKLFATTDLCGLYLHQLVALESVLSLRYPLPTADLFSRPCSITLSVALYLLCLACAVLTVYVGLPFALASTGISIVTFILTVKAPPTPHNVAVTNTRPGQWVLVVTMVTLIVFYLPSLVTQYLASLQAVYRFADMRYLDSALLVTFSLRSLRLISDTLLCVLGRADAARLPQKGTVHWTDTSDRGLNSELCVIGVRPAVSCPRECSVVFSEEEVETPGEIPRFPWYPEVPCSDGDLQGPDRTVLCTGKPDPYSPLISDNTIRVEV
ncbi:hypothetical protein NFI96_008580 [Prochilodus magdalenae]|nr:hypothetical protein NFI96_008580 [Prochilodus magdalenae]